MQVIGPIPLPHPSITTRHSSSSARFELISALVNLQINAAHAVKVEQRYMFHLESIILEATMMTHGRIER